MSDDLICPECKHPLGFHSYYYGKCDVPVGGTFIHEKCGCTLTLHDLIKMLQSRNLDKEVEDLKRQNQINKDELIKGNNLLIDAIKKTDSLLNKLDRTKEILERAKLIDFRFVDGWLGIEYKRKIRDLLDEALLEMEKND